MPRIVARPAAVLPPVPFRFIALVCAVLSACPTGAFAAARQNVPPAVWQALQAAAPGTEVEVTLTSGAKVRGRLVDAGSDAVRLNANEVLSGRFVTAANTTLRDTQTFQRGDVVAVNITGKRYRVGSEAQPPTARPHPYVFASVGRGGFMPGDNAASRFSGMTSSAAAGVLFGGRAFLEVATDQLAYSRNDWAGWDGKATALLVRVGYRFRSGGGSARFLVSGAAGHMRDTWHYPSVVKGETTVRHERADYFVCGIGAGVDVDVTSHVFVRPDVNVLISAGNAVARAAIAGGWRF